MVAVRSWRARAVVTVALVALLAAACGSDDEKASDTTTPATSKAVPITGVPGVTDDEIRFSVIGTSTAKNPTGSCTLECYVNGIKAYFAYRNSEGGIYGRDLVLDTPLDDELGKGQQLAIQVVSADDTLAVFTNTLISNYAEFVKAKWPVYSRVTDHGAAAGNLNIFGNNSVSSFDIPRIADGFLPKYYNATKIGVVGYGVGSSQTCVDQIVKEFEGEYKELGSVVYANKGLAFGLANGVGPEVTAMKQAGVELIYTCIETNGFKTFAQELSRQKVDAHMVTFGSFEEDFITQNAEILEGMVQMSRERPAVSAPTKGRELLDKWAKEIGVEVLQETLQGWGNADLMFQGLKKAGAPFDRQKLIDATNTLKQWTGDGLFAPVDVGRQHEGASPTDPVTHGDIPNCFAFLEIKDGKLTPLEPETKEKPYVCWPGDTYTYSDPEAMSFD
jgi:branched-chain amino acid transport system substrate-binding protein